MSCSERNGPWVWFGQGPDLDPYRAICGQKTHPTTIRSLACGPYHAEIRYFCYPLSLIGCVIYRAERGQEDPASHFVFTHPQRMFPSALLTVFSFPTSFTVPIQNRTDICSWLLNITTHGTLDLATTPSASSAHYTRHTPRQWFRQPPQQCPWAYSQRCPLQLVR
jgi:hypothetical protein